MSPAITEHTKAVLLLTAPLLVGKPGRDDPKVLTPTEYNKLASRLVELGRQPTDLTSPKGAKLIGDLADIVEGDRLSRLLARGLLMSQAIDMWQSRGIWVVSRAETEYPKRLKTKLKKHAPPLIYGCGDHSLLDKGGLAIVGSRKVDESISVFVKKAAELAAQSGYSVVSGGAKGVDQTAMQSALEVEGTVIGVLAENLSRAVVAAHFRQAIKTCSLTLISHVDPNMGFNVGNAMSRNKMIYALADAGLVANADLGKGGTWSGAIEQINRFKCCPVYVRTTNKTPKGNQGLIDKGAREWPEMRTSNDFQQLMTGALPQKSECVGELELKDSLKASGVSDVSVAGSGPKEIRQKPHQTESPARKSNSPANQIKDYAERVILHVLNTSPLNETELSEKIGIVKSQLRLWLKELLAEGKIEKEKNPIKYRIMDTIGFSNQTIGDKSVFPAKQIRGFAEKAILDLIRENPSSEAELLDRLGISNPQLKAWLKRLMAEDKIEKINSRMKYQIKVKQPELFSEEE